MKDHLLISDEYHEISLVAKSFGIKPSEVYRIKESVGNSRKNVYAEIERLKNPNVKPVVRELARIWIEKLNPDARDMQDKLAIDIQNYAELFCREKLGE